MKYRREDNLNKGEFVSFWTDNKELNTTRKYYKKDGSLVSFYKGNDTNFVFKNLYPKKTLSHKPPFLRHCR